MSDVNKLHPLIHELEPDEAPQSGSVWHVRKKSPGGPIERLAKRPLLFGGGVKSYVIQRPASICTDREAAAAEILGDGEEKLVVKIVYDVVQCLPGRELLLLEAVLPARDPGNGVAERVRALFDAAMDKLVDDAEDRKERFDRLSVFTRNHNYLQQQLQKNIRDVIGLEVRLRLQPDGLDPKGLSLRNLSIPRVSAKIPGRTEDFFINFVDLQITPIEGDEIASAQALSRTGFLPDRVRDAVLQLFLDKAVNLHAFSFDKDTVALKIQQAADEAIAPYGWKIAYSKFALDCSRKVEREIQHSQDVSCRIRDWHESITVHHDCRLRVDDLDKFFGSQTQREFNSVKDWLEATLKHVSESEMMEVNIRRLAEESSKDKGTIEEKIKDTVRERAREVGCEIVVHTSKPRLGLEWLSDGFPITIKGDFETKDGMSEKFPFEINCRLRITDPARITGWLVNDRTLRDAIVGKLEQEISTLVSEYFAAQTTRRICFELGGGGGTGTVHGDLQENIRSHLDKLCKATLESFNLRQTRTNELLKYYNDVTRDPGTLHIEVDVLDQGISIPFDCRYHIIGIAPRPGRETKSPETVAAEQDQSFARFFQSCYTAEKKPSDVRADVQASLETALLQHLPTLDGELSAYGDDDIRDGLREYSFQKCLGGIWDRLGLLVAVDAFYRGETPDGRAIRRMRDMEREAHIERLKNAQEKINELALEGRDADDITREVHEKEARNSIQAITDAMPRRQKADLSKLRNRGNEKVLKLAAGDAAEKPPAAAEKPLDEGNAGA